MGARRGHKAAAAATRRACHPDHGERERLHAYDDASTTRSDGSADCAADRGLRQPAQRAAGAPAKAIQGTKRTASTPTSSSQTQATRLFAADRFMERGDEERVVGVGQRVAKRLRGSPGTARSARCVEPTLAAARLGGGNVVQSAGALVPSLREAAAQLTASAAVAALAAAARAAAARLRLREQGHQTPPPSEEQQRNARAEYKDRAAAGKQPAAGLARLRKVAAAERCDAPTRAHTTTDAPGAPLRCVRILRCRPVGSETRGEAAQGGEAAALPSEHEVGSALEQQQRQSLSLHPLRAQPRRPPHSARTATPRRPSQLGRQPSAARAQSTSPPRRTAALTPAAAPAQPLPTARPLLLPQWRMVGALHTLADEVADEEEEEEEGDSAFAQRHSRADSLFEPVVLSPLVRTAQPCPFGPTPCALPACLLRERRCTPPLAAAVHCPSWLRGLPSGSSRCPCSPAPPAATPPAAAPCAAR